jgi:hypothetical protein
MKTTMILSLLAFLLVSPGEGRPIQAQPGEEKPGGMEALEKTLREARVKKIEKEILGGRTGPWLVTLDTGAVKQRAVFRHVDRQRPNLTPDSYKYDLAAYELTKLLGIELIPPVVEREIDGRPGSLQIFLENCIREKDRKRKKLEPPDPEAFSRSIAGIRVFEYLTYDECQDTDHLFVHTEDWRVCRVDFSEAFAPASDPLPGCEITVCARRLYEGLVKTDEQTIKTTLGRFLNEVEIQGLLTRKDLIIAKIKELIAEKGEQAVLF